MHRGSLDREDPEAPRELAKHVNLTGAIPGDVAGHSAYTIRVSPKHDGGLLGAGELAWDAIKGVPLRIAVYAQNDSSPVLELKATDISYGTVAPSVFNVAPPSGAKVVRVDTAKAHTNSRTRAMRLRNRRHRDVTGVEGRRPETSVLARRAEDARRAPAAGS